jgi:hypothetical protein
MTRPSTASERAAHAAFRKQLANENVRAAFLHAKQRAITARLKAGRKQLELPFELKETA